jgi:hypothetical protein
MQQKERKKKGAVNQLPYLGSWELQHAHMTKKVSKIASGYRSLTEADAAEK